ncbi:hypothetical protein [Mucilaginibacter sp.]|uniref:hypothetical protein n=1 Tax=Mucilaginibacter sp. TaxID=1882438 RepID=UPI003B00B4AD
MDTYLQTTEDIYRTAALKPDVGLCCTTTPMNSPAALNRDDIFRSCPTFFL